jgi:hypothetical protein
MLRTPSALIGGPSWGERSEGAFGPLGVGQVIQKEGGMKGLAPSFTLGWADAPPCLQRAPPGITSDWLFIADLSSQNRRREPSRQGEPP